MKRSKAVDVLRGLDPVRDQETDEAASSPQARALLDSIVESEPGRSSVRTRRRLNPRLATAAAVALLIVPAGVGLWLAFGPALDRDPGPTGVPIGDTSPPSSPVPSVVPTSPPPDQLYEATTTVIHEPGEDAVLCLGGVLDSLPPQCGGVPVPNWDWDALKGEEEQGGTRWGDFHVVGTYDGQTFTLVRSGPPKPSPPETEDPFPIPCPEPEGGWRVIDPDRAKDSDLQAANHYTNQQPDRSGLWISYLEEPQGEYDRGPYVLNVAFTGDIERHRQAISELWGGPLCVVQYERSLPQLVRIQNELSNRGGAEEFGLEVTWSSTSVQTNHVELGVIVADPAQQSAVDARYGEGVVELIPALQPVD
jgi:hypothetical protein